MERFKLFAKVLAFLGIGGLLFAFFYQVKYGGGSGVHQKLKQRTVGFEPLQQFVQLNWAADSLWNNTQERCKYSFSNGKDTNYVLYTTLQKEIFNPQYRVKTSDTIGRIDLYAAMRMNMGYSIDSEQHSMGCMVFLANNPLLLDKYTCSWQDARGNTFKTFLNKNGVIRLTYQSFWDKEGEEEKNLQKMTLLEDQFIYSLRSLNWTPGEAFTIKMIDKQLKSTIGSLEPETAYISVEKDTLLDGVAHRKAILHFSGDKQTAYCFQKEYPNVCTNIDYADGSSLKLLSSEYRKIK